MSLITVVWPSLLLSRLGEVAGSADFVGFLNGFPQVRAMDSSVAQYWGRLFGHIHTEVLIQVFLLLCCVCAMTYVVVSDYKRSKAVSRARAEAPELLWYNFTPYSEHRLKKETAIDSVPV